jgi:hypothetical protein
MEELTANPAGSLQEIPADHHRSPEDDGLLMLGSVPRTETDLTRALSP